MTPAEAQLRAKVSDQVLGSYQNRWIEKQIRWAHEAGEDPAKATKRAVGCMGHMGGDVWWDTCPNGIRVRTLPPGIEFVIPWREIATRAIGAAKPAQMSLF